MNRYLLIIINIGLLSFVSFAEEKEDTISKIRLGSIIQVNQSNSYFTFPTDIGKIEPLWFEACIIPNIHLRKNKNSRFVGVITTQIVTRMYREVSFPIRTPSFIPQLSGYYLLKSNKDYNSLSIFSKVAHHSNGQEANIFFENGEINFENGSFTTNFGEIGIIKTIKNIKNNSISFYRTSIEIHVPSLTVDDMKGMYSLYRLNSMFTVFNIPETANKKSLSMQSRATWMFGKMNNRSSYSLDRFNISLTLYYHLKFLEDIGLFAQFYHGMDYYNLFFDRQITLLRFGIMTEKLRF